MRTELTIPQRLLLFAVALITGSSIIVFVVGGVRAWNALHGTAGSAGPLLLLQVVVFAAECLSGLVGLLRALDRGTMASGWLTVFFILASLDVEVRHVWLGGTAVTLGVALKAGNAHFGLNLVGFLVAIAYIHYCEDAKVHLNETGRAA